MQWCNANVLHLSSHPLAVLDSIQCLQKHRRELLSFSAFSFIRIATASCENWEKVTCCLLHWQFKPLITELIKKFTSISKKKPNPPPFSYMVESFQLIYLTCFTCDGEGVLERDYAVVNKPTYRLNPFATLAHIKHCWTPLLMW